MSLIRLSKVVLAYLHSEWSNNSNKITRLDVFDDVGLKQIIWKQWSIQNPTLFCLLLKIIYIFGLVLYSNLIAMIRAKTKIEGLLPKDMEALQIWWMKGYGGIIKMNENVQHSGLEEQYLQLLGTDINITTLLSAPCAYRIWYTSPSLYIVLQNTYIMYMTTHKLYC